MTTKNTLLCEAKQAQQKIHKQTSKNTLVSQIRHAEEPDNPKLILQLLTMHEEHAFGSKDIRRHFLLFQFNLLLGTLKDKSISRPWRYQCLNYIHIPLNALHKIAECIESRQYVHMLARQVELANGELHNEF